MRWLRRLLWTGALLGLLGGVGYWYACRWLREELIRRARDVFGVEVSIGEVSLHPLSSSVSLYDVAATVPPGAPRDILQGGSLRLQRATLWLDAGSSWEAKQPYINEIEIEAPVLEATVRLPSIPPAFGDLKRLRAYLREHKPKERRATLPHPIHALTITNGRASFTITRPGAEPVPLVLESLSYRATELREIGLTPLLAQSQFETSIGGARLTRAPGLISLRGLDLVLLGRVFGASDSLRFSSGSLDVEWKDQRVTVTLSQPRLGGALSLISLGQTLSYSFPLGGEDAPTDTISLLAEFWAQFGGGIMDKLDSKARDAILKEALKRLDP